MSSYTPGNDIYDGVLRRRIDHSRVNMRVTSTDTEGGSVIEVWETDHPPHYLVVQPDVATAADVIASVVMACGVQPLTHDVLMKVDVNRLSVAAATVAGKMLAIAEHPSCSGTEWSASELEWWYRMRWM